MADLTTPAEKAIIQQGLQDVMNTLHQTDVSLFIKLLSLDLRQINAGAAFTEYQFKTIVKEKRKVNNDGVEGSRNVNHISIKFHITDFEAAGLVGIDGELLFNSSDSYLMWNGSKYNLVSLSQEDIAVRIEGELAPIVR